MKLKIVYLSIFSFLFLLNTSAIFGQKLVVNNFQKIPTDISAREHKVTDINDEACALLKIYTGLKDLKIDGNMGVEKTEQRPGVLWVWVNHGTRQLKISKDNMPMLPFYIPSALDESTVYSFELTTDELFSIVINTQNVEAAVTIKTEKYKSNMPITDLPAGQYIISISAFGYVPIKDTIQVDKKNLFFKYILKEAKQSVLTITTSPKNCILFINGEQIGLTDYSRHHYPGDYKLRISAQDYLSLDTNIVFDPLKQNTFNFTLTRSVGWLNVKSTPTASIVVDGKTAYSDNIKLSARTPHQLKITKPLYNDYFETFNITANDTSVKNIVLEKISGQFSFIIEPKSTPVKIIDRHNIETNWIGETVKDLPIGKYQLEARKKGYKKLETTFTIITNENKHLSLALKPKKFSRLGAGVLSMLLPGTGQYYSQRNGVGTLYLITTGSLAAATGILNMNANHLSETYLDAQESYRNETDPFFIDSRREDMDRAYEKYLDANDQKNTFLYITAGVYILNVIDAIVFAKRHKPDLKNGITDNFKFKVGTNPKLSSAGFYVSYKF